MPRALEKSCKLFPFFIIYTKLLPGGPFMRFTPLFDILLCNLLLIGISEFDIDFDRFKPNSLRKLPLGF